MALQSRGAIPKVINPTRENENVKTKAKAYLNQHVTTRRPALNEIGNKIDADTKHPLKQADTLKDHANKTVPVAYSAQALEEIIDPDADCKNDPQMVAEYIADIYKYWRQMETKYAVKENFLQGHQTTSRMRAVLVNWLVEVHMSFKLCLETLYLAVSLIDRYLQNNKDVGRSTLQLVGTASLLLACKYEETYWPELSNFTYVTDDAFTQKQIIHMERVILKDLDFCLGKPTAILFLRRYSKLAVAKKEHYTLAKYLLELALMEYTLSPVRPSILAAAASCLSQALLNEVTCPSKVWTATLEKYTTYKYSDFKPVVVNLAKVLAKVDLSKNQMIKQKYSSSAFAKISLSSCLRGSLVRKLTSDASIPGHF